MRIPETVVRSLAAVHWNGKDVDMAVEVSRLETGGTFESTSHNDNYLRGGKDDSYGLYQINMKGILGVERRKRYNLPINELLYDATINTGVAYRVWQDAGNSWSPWSTSAAAATAIVGGSSDSDSHYGLSDADWKIWETIPIDARRHITAALLNDVALIRPTGLSDDQWRVLQAVHVYIDTHGGPTSTNLNPIDAVGDLVSDIGTPLDWMKALAKFLSILMNPEFWKRVGLGVLAAAVILLAFVVFNKETIQGLK